MPYRRNHYRRRGARRPFRPGYDRTSGNYGKFTNNIHHELKFKDTLVALNPIKAASDSTNIIVSPAQGAIIQDDTSTGRDGLKIIVRSLHFIGNLLIPKATAGENTHDQVRIYLTLDKQCNGASPTVASMLDLQTAHIFSFKNLENSFRFQTLWSKMYSINNVGGAGNGTADEWGAKLFPISFNLTGLHIPIYYDNSAATGVITTIRSNNLVLWAVSRSTRVGINGTLRCRFNG